MAVAIILAFVGLVSITEVQRFVPWATNIMGLFVAAIICCLLLVLMSPRAMMLMGLASTLSVLIFSAFWTYSTWRLVGAVFSLADPVTLNLLILYLVPRSLILFFTAIAGGALTVIAVRFVRPDFDAADGRNSPA